MADKCVSHSYTAKHTPASLADVLEKDYAPGGKALYLAEHEWRMVIDALRYQNAAPQEPSGKSPGTAGNSGYEQKASRGAPVRDVPADAAAITPPAGPSGRVWMAANKTSFILFDTERAAYDYVRSFPASVAGGMLVSAISVYSSPPATASPE